MKKLDFLPKSSTLKSTLFFSTHRNLLSTQRQSQLRVDNQYRCPFFGLEFLSILGTNDILNRIMFWRGGEIVLFLDVEQQLCPLLMNVRPDDRCPQTSSSVEMG